MKTVFNFKQCDNNYPSNDSKTSPTTSSDHLGFAVEHSDVAFLEKYYSENFPENFPHGKISATYFYILPYYITNVIGTLG